MSWLGPRTFGHIVYVNDFALREGFKLNYLNALLFLTSTLLEQKVKLEPYDPFSCASGGIR